MKNAKHWPPSRAVLSLSPESLSASSTACQAPSLADVDGFQDETQTHFCDSWVVEQVKVHESHFELGLTFVPELVRELPAPHREAAKVALARACVAGLIELRPDGGLSRFTREELDACPKAFDGSSLLWARVL
jgi:hypothetical protein